MTQVEKVKGSVDCNHSWVKREKKTIQVLTRFCQNCGRVEDGSDSLDEATINAIKGDK